MKAPLSSVTALFLSLALSVGGAWFWFQTHAARLLETAVAHQAECIEAARPDKPWDFWTSEMEQVAKELAEQRALLARRDVELAAHEKRLADERAELDLVRRQIEALRAEMDSRLVQVAAQEQRNLKTLAATYSRLSPAAAVAIFNQMDDLLVSKLLSFMKPEVSSGILEELSRDPGPDGANVKRAAELTQRLRLLVSAPAPATR